MKKIVYIIAALAISACTGNDSNTYQKEAEKLSELLENYMANYDDSSDIKAEYNKEDGCIDMSWKGKMLNASYELRFKDLLTDNPQSYAEDFTIYAVLFDTTINVVRDMEFSIHGVSFKVKPSMMEHYDKFIALGFTSSDELFTKTLELLSHQSGVVDAWLNTNRGKIEIPFYDVTNIQAMAINYRLDGGKFEREKKELTLKVFEK